MNNVRRLAGFTLIELIVAIGIVALLAAIAVPVYSRVSAQARAVECMGNLRQIGVALNLYLGEHNLIMPTMAAGRDDAGSPDKSLDTVFATYVDGDDDVFRCPADSEGLWHRTGTSYLWNNILNGQHIDRIDFFGLRGRDAGIPVVADKEAFHQYVEDEVNVLWADGHVDRRLTFKEGRKGRK